MTGGMNKRIIRTALVVFALCFSNAPGQLSPGALSGVHMHLEGIGNCTKCHSAGKQVDADKCFVCHTLLKERVEAGKGLHAQQNHQVCQTCHVEHHGRNFSLIRWPMGSREHFDHGDTGYPLKGRHAELDCRLCHNRGNLEEPERYLQAGKDPDRTYLGLAAGCASCHPDVHRGQFGNSCSDCHGEEGWTPAPGFDHSRTGYPLAGKHAAAACDSCHYMRYDNDGGYRQYTAIEHAQCSACHVDVHKGRLGGDCSSCHQPQGWSAVPEGMFNHDMTEYPLKGRHAELACSACHPQGHREPIVRFQQCTDCHTDAHSGQFRHREEGGACEECHTEEGFIPSTFTFGRHQQTDFPLTGGHQAVPCIDCHTAENGAYRKYRFETLACQGCHADIHEGQTDRFISATAPGTGGGGCSYCHSTAGWNSITFDHGLTGFPLQGRHALAGCRDCHYTAEDAAWRFADRSGQCQQCHEDVHDGQFGAEQDRSFTDCSRCHTAVDWLAEKFNHNLHTDFPLTGRHRFLACGACHKPYTRDGRTYIRYRPLGKKCDDCHHDRSGK